MDHLSLRHSTVFQSIISGGSTNILLAGCGGGYDVFSALPLYEALMAHHSITSVHLSNLTFTCMDIPRISKGHEEMIPNVMWKVADEKQQAGIDEDSGYFPELYLSQFLEGKPVYTISRSNFKGVTNAYSMLVDKLQLDCIVLCDGGTDSMMFGNEVGLGTPIEDFLSIAAVHFLPNPGVQKYLVCIGHGVDFFHGVNGNLFLENVATLTKEGHFYGSVSVLPSMAKLMNAACDYAFERMQVSIVNGSIREAVNGNFGNVQFTPRTRGSELFINPLMAIYWCFDLAAVANHNICVEALREATSLRHVDRIINDVRKDLELRQPSVFPH